MASNPKERLTGLFQSAGGANAQGNDALRYVAPREPSRQTQQQSATPAAAPAAAPTAASAIVYSTSVALFKYDTSARKYVQMSDAAAPSNVTIGCVIVGSGTAYTLLFYTASKQHVCAVPVKFATLKPTLQAKHYVNLYDDKGVNWSVKFTSDDHVREFMRNVFLVKIHEEIWGDEKTRTKAAPNTLISDDLNFSKADGYAVRNGDTVAVSFNCWRVVGNATCPPQDVVTKYPAFEQASASELRKFRLGGGSERIKALEEGVVGMQKGGKRMILAPPGKTNGQDWYLIEVELVKTKSGSTTTRRPTPVPTPAPAPADEGEATAKTPRSRPNSGGKRTPKANLSDELVPYDEAVQDELQLKELKLKQREKELEIQAKALQQAQLNGGMFNGGMAQQQQQQQQQQAAAAAAALYGQPSFSFSPFGGAGGVFPGANAVSAPGRPLDSMLMELNAKVDYLIRMAPTANSQNSFGAGGMSAGAADVSSVIRGVERLAGENERLLLQINSQNQQYTSYEKRCEELLRQNQKLQEEKRAAQENYQSVASQQVNFHAELASVASARDAAITQTNRLHAEYQQLLAAFYQKQQVSTENDEQRNALAFERDARVRLEAQLQKETQTRSLVEQELQLVKKQYAVVTKMKDSELSTQRQELEAQLLNQKATEQRALEDQLRQDFQQQQSRLMEQHTLALERKDLELQTRVDSIQNQLAQILEEKRQLQQQLDSAMETVQTLEASAATAASAPALAAESATGVGLAEEEKLIYQEQISLLQQQVKELEAEKFARVQEDLDSGRLASPHGSPRAGASSGFGGESECVNCAKIAEREAAVERSVALAQEIRREADALVAASGNGDSENGGMDRARLEQLFKEAVNDMFFRFQEVFEGADAAGPIEVKQVLTVIRKVLKQSTRYSLQRLQETESASASGQEEHDDASSQDGGPPSPPPQLEQDGAEAAQTSEHQTHPELGFDMGLPSVPMTTTLQTERLAVPTHHHDNGDESDHESEDSFAD